MTKKWKLVSKKGKNFENLFVSIVAEGMAPKKIIKKGPLQLICSAWLQIGGNRYFPKVELEAHIKKIISLLKREPETVMAEYQYYEHLLNKMEIFASKIPQTSFNKLNLTKYLQEWASHLSRTLQYGYNYYFLNQPIAEVVLKAIERNKIPDAFLVFETFSQAKKLSVIQQEKIDLLRLVKKIKVNKLSLKSKLVKEAVSKHLKKYGFMGHYYFRGKPWREAEVIQRLKSWLKDDWSKEIKQLNHFEQASGITKKLIKKYKFTPFEKKLIYLMKEIAYATNRYDEVHNYLSFKSQGLLKYVARKTGVKYSELIEIGFRELLDLLKKNKKATKAFRGILRKRDQVSAFLTYYGQVKIITGPAVKKFFKKEIGETVVLKKDLLKGQGASQGEARGKVVIFKTEADIAKVKKGDIMVAFATVPSFVPAMEKAAAIVTEMGGLLSHAAIVSRELKVPCVVGVENVMKILKEGDLVEVDATKGVVKKLN